MKQRKWVACPNCGDIISPYNETLEKNRERDKFKAWCESCHHAVEPIYI